MGCNLKIEEYSEVDFLGLYDQLKRLYTVHSNEESEELEESVKDSIHALSISDSVYTVETDDGEVLMATSDKITALLFGEDAMFRHGIIHVRTWVDGESKHITTLSSG